MNKGLAKALNVKIGDKIFIEGKNYRLVETVNDLTATGAAPDMLFLNQKVVKKYIQTKQNNNAEATYLLIKAKKDINPLTLSSEIKLYNKKLRIDIAEQDYGMQSNLQSLRIFVVVLSVIILIVTSLIIISNFELLLYKMRNQFVIMRSLGASTKQISRIITIQSTIINASGISLGFILTLFSQRSLYKLVEKILNISSTPSEFNIGAAVIIAIVTFSVIQLFLIIPSYRSTKVLPLKTMEKNEKLNFGYSKARVNVFKVLVGISLFLIVCSQVLPTRETYGPTMLLISVVLVLLTFVLIFSILLPKFLEWFLPYGQKLFGREFYISIKNLIPQVRKNTVIILMISSLMIIAVFGSITLRTIQVSQQDQLKEDYATPILVGTRLDDTKISPTKFTKEVEKLPDVKSVSNFSTLGSAEYQNEGRNMSMSYAVVDLKRLQAQGLIPHLKQVVEPKGNYKVVDIEEQLLNGADAYVDWKNKKLIDVSFYLLYVESKHIKNAVNQLEGLKSQYSEMKISNYEQSAKEADKMFYQRWGIFILVIATLVVSTMVGVFNSLVNNIYSKRKEFAVLRAMGVTPKSLRKVILSQVNLYIIIGLIIGTLMGLLTTFILLLVDPGKFVIDCKVIITVSLSMLVGSVFIFWFVGNKISSQKLSVELTNDNK
ncbi:FtsX-like permease family protein [Priestia aryabhattai]